MPNRPLEWTGRHRVSARVLHSLLATQGQRWARLHHIQQRRHLLHLIDHHGAGAGLRIEPFPQAYRPGLMQPLGLRIEQIEPEGTLLRLAQPGGFPRAPGP